MDENINLQKKYENIPKELIKQYLIEDNKWNDW